MASVSSEWELSRGTYAALKITVPDAKPSRGLERLAELNIMAVWKLWVSRDADTCSDFFTFP